MPTRVKSDAEYSKILGVEDEINVNSAQEFFSTQKDEVKDNNPFENTLTLADIKKQIREKEIGDIDSIKKEIAQAQVNAKKDDIADRKEFTKPKFSFEENARQLYENLRANALNNHLTNNDGNDLVDDVKESKEVKEDIVENDKKLIEIIEDPVESNNVEYEDLSNEEVLSLMSDFKDENKAFLNEIEDKKEGISNNSSFDEINKAANEDFISKLENDSEFREGVSDLIESLDELDKYDITDVDTSGNTAILNELESQMASLEQDVKKEDSVEEIAITDLNKEEKDVVSSLDLLFADENSANKVVDKDNSKNEEFSKQLEQLTALNDNVDKGKEKDFNNTLSLALDKDKALTFNNNEIDYLKDDTAESVIPKKAKIFDILLTVFLVIMICVVGFLLARTFFMGN